MSNSSPNVITQNAALFSLYSDSEGKEVMIGSKNVAYLYSISKMLHCIFIKLYLIVSEKSLSTVIDVFHEVQLESLNLENIYDIIERINPDFDRHNPYEIELFNSVYPVLAYFNNNHDLINIKQVYFYYIIV